MYILCYVFCIIIYNQLHLSLFATCVAEQLVLLNTYNIHLYYIILFSSKTLTKPIGHFYTKSIDRFQVNDRVSTCITVIGCCPWPDTRLRASWSSIAYYPFPQDTPLPSSLYVLSAGMQFLFTSDRIMQSWFIMCVRWVCVFPLGVPPPRALSDVLGFFLFEKPFDLGIACHDDTTTLRS